MEARYALLHCTTQVQNGATRFRYFLPYSLNGYRELQMFTMLGYSPSGVQAI